jgi:hypothetical protein
LSFVRSSGVGLRLTAHHFSPGRDRSGRGCFDSFRAMVRTGYIQVDGLATKPVETNRYVFGDGTDNKRAPWGVY